MRFIITAQAGADRKTGEQAPDFDAELFQAYMRFNEEMHQAGVLVASEGLNPAAPGARIAVADGKRYVVDGPFAESKELVGGFYLIEVGSLDEAIHWALRAPSGFGSDDILEVRQLTGAGDLSPDMLKLITEAAPTWSASAWQSRPALMADGSGKPGPGAGVVKQGAVVQGGRDMIAPAKNTVCLWYQDGAEEAARFYAETFPDSQVGAVFRAPSDFPSGKKGDVLTVAFTVLGIPCLGLNGGPAFTQSEAFSFQVATKDQAETDRYWNAIVGNGGQASACGWCKDRWGVSWQITPVILTQAIADPDPAVAKRAFDAMMEMGKIDISAIEAALRG